MCKKVAYLAEVLISSLPARLPFLQVIVCDKDHSALQSGVNAFNLDLMMMMLMMMMMIMYSSVFRRYITNDFSEAILYKLQS